MKTKLLPLSIAIGLSVASLQTQAWDTDIPRGDTKAYAQDSDGDVVRDRFGRCVRTIHWTKETAINKCEGWPEPVVVQAPVAAPAPKPAAPAPAPVAAPEPKPEPVAAPVVAMVAAPIAFSGLFETNGNTLTSDAEAKLDKYAEYLEAHPEKNLSIVGHTDDTGAASYNQALSEKRAGAVKTYLESKGIASSRLTAGGMGESAPKATNATKQGRADNRRVEIEITD